MKSKNVNIIEAHFEKAVLGASVLFLAVIVVFYIVMPFTYPVRVKGKATDQPVTLKLLNENLQRSTQRIDRLLSDSAESQVPPMIVPNYAQRVESMLNRPYMQEKSSPIWGNLGYIMPEGTRDVVDAEALYIAKFAPITNLTVKQGINGFVDPAAAQGLKLQAPYDTQWALIEGTLNLRAILTELARNPGGQTRPIPREWYASTLAIVDIVLERQVLKDDGSWSEPVVMGPIPGAQDVLTRIRSLDLNNVTPEQANQIRTLLQTNLTQIFQPTFPTLRNVVIPSVPVPLRSTVDVAPAADQPALGAAPIAPAPFNQDSITLRAYDWNLKPNTSYRYRLSYKITNPLFNQKVMPKEQGEFNEKRFAVSSMSLENWNKLPGIEPLPENSDWSEPITGITTGDFYLTGNTNANGSTTFSVWKFHNGLWRRAEFEVRDGDAIGRRTGEYLPADEGINAPIDFFTGYYVVDINPRHTLRQPGAARLQTTRVVMVKDNKLFERFTFIDQTKANDFEAKLAEIQSQWTPAPVLPDPEGQPILPEGENQDNPAEGGNGQGNPDNNDDSGVIPDNSDLRDDPNFREPPQ